MIRNPLEKKAIFFCALMGAALCGPAVGLSPAPMTRAARVQANAQASEAEILAASAEKGKALMAALRDYTYFAELTIETVSQADTITGKFSRLSEISFDKLGNRQERVIENTSTLPEDVHIGTNTAFNLIRVYQFIVTPETLRDYEFNYIGRERVDELNTYVFDVQPKVKLPDPDKSGERYLRGRVWIDDQDRCVVKVEGQVLPEQGALRTPKFTTYYQNVDRFWLPSFAEADDRVRVGRYWIRVGVKVRFTSYRKATKKG
jgi:hypothetical protein